MTALPARWDEERAAPRDAVLYRTRGTDRAGQPMLLTVVNISDGGFMARCDAALTIGDRITVDLPVLGTAQAEVRWALGGRIGCQWQRQMPTATYAALRAALG